MGASAAAIMTVGYARAIIILCIRRKTLRIKFAIFETDANPCELIFFLALKRSITAQ